ncbi:DUF1194 domain-containing protein [Leisingera sp. S232]
MRYSWTSSLFDSGKRQASACRRSNLRDSQSESSTAFVQQRPADVTVNAIAIEQSEPDLTAYFFENVIRGDGAFVVTAASFEDYPSRIRKKLVREIARKTALLHSGGGTAAKALQ